MDTIKKNPALLIGILYILGVLVTAIHLSRFAIYDLELTKIRYIFAGGMCVFYLLLRFTISALLIDFRVFRSTLRTAEQTSFRMLKKMILFKWLDHLTTLRFLALLTRSFSRRRKILRTINQITSLRFLGLGYQPFTTRRVARIVIRSVAMFSLYFPFFVFLACIKRDNIPFALSFQLVTDPPIAIALLFWTQVAYYIWIRFKPAFKATQLLRRMWQVVITLLIILDTVVYSLIIHPLVKPFFGGGVIVEASLFPKDEQIAKRLEAATSIHFGDRSDRVFILQISGDAYFITPEYQPNYSARVYSDLIRYDKVYRIEKSLISGYEVIGFR